MGLRCVCPQGHVLNIKPELAGKQGICPKCGSSFTIEQTASASSPAAASQPSGASLGASTHESVPAVPEAVEWRLANPQGEQFGPTVPTLFAQWIAQGRVPPDWLVWRTGWSEWRRADEAESELPASLPTSQPSETPPPLAVAAVSNATTSNAITAPTKTNSASQPNRVSQSSPFSQSNSVSQPNPVNEYTLRRQRAVKRQRMVIALLAFVTLALVGLLIWIAMRSTVS